MTIWKVYVEERRSTTFYVHGDDRAMTEQDAHELAYELDAIDWDEVDSDVTIREDAFPKEGHLLWTGGPDGDWGRRRHERARMSMTAFYYLYPHRLLAKKYAAALSELRELGDAASLHSVKEQRWAEKEAAYLARIGDLTDDLAEAIEREVV